MAWKCLNFCFCFLGVFCLYCFKLEILSQSQLSYNYMLNSVDNLVKIETENLNQNKGTKRKILTETLQMPYLIIAVLVRKISTFYLSNLNFNLFWTYFEVLSFMIKDWYNFIEHFYHLLICDKISSMTFSSLFCPFQ